MNQLTEEQAQEIAQAHGQLMQMAYGGVVAQMIYVMAKLNIADRIGTEVKPVAELAIATETHEDSLYRLLRSLAGVGVVAEAAPRAFALTPMGHAMRSDVPHSLRSFVLMQNETWAWNAWGELLHTVRSGEIAFEHVHGMPFFPYIMSNPQYGQDFHAAMVGFTQTQVAALIPAYDFAAFRKIVDVGGGLGALLAAIVALHPDAQGVLFDQPHVVEGTSAQLAMPALEGRCEAQGGDFFAEVPAGGDLYLLKTVLHDWDDEKARTILKNVRAAISEGGRLLVIEALIAPGPQYAMNNLLDLGMMVIAGGRERTEAEYGALLQQAGFELARVLPTASNLCILEALPV